MAEEVRLPGRDKEKLRCLHLINIWILRVYCASGLSGGCVKIQIARHYTQHFRCRRSEVGPENLHF